MRFRLMSVDAVELAAIRADTLTRPLTYPETGATFTTTNARYYFHDSRSIDLGTGAQVFAAAKRALRRWAAHQGAGATIPNVAGRASWSGAMRRVTSPSRSPRSPDRVSWSRGSGCRWFGSCNTAPRERS